MISVVVSSYNSLPLLKTFFASLDWQTNKSFEVVVADDGSTDGTVEWLQGNNIKFVTQEDEGFRLSLIRNKAVDVCEKDWVMFTDCDCILKENLIEEALKFILKNDNQSIDFDFPRYELFTDGEVDLFKLDDYKATLLFEWTKIGRKRIIGSCIICKTDAIKTIGGFDITYNNYGWEDVDLTERLYYLGYKFFNLRSSSYWHKNHRTWDESTIESTQSRLKFNESFKGVVSLHKGYSFC